MAVAGSAVGLGNVWTFPCAVAEHGGGAFVLVYLASILAVGMPLLVAELSLGRLGGSEPAQAFTVATAGRRGAWRWSGRFMTLTSLTVLSLVGFVGGWALDFTWLGLTGSLGRHGGGAADRLGSLLSDPTHLLTAHTLFMALIAGILAGGVREGIERAVRWTMPALFAFLVALVSFAFVTSASFGSTLRWLFVPDSSRLTSAGVLEALGHGFLTLGIGAGAMICYGAFAGREVSLARTAVAVALIDTVVALLAALLIVSIVSDAGLEPGRGPGLLFVTLPTAFASLTGGGALGAVFFAFLSLVAVTSAIALLAPVVIAVQRRFHLTTPAAALAAVVCPWLIGALTAASFGTWSNPRIAGHGLLDVLDVLDALTRRVMLPAGGLLMALALGWAADRRLAALASGLQGPRWLSWWRAAVRILAPGAVVVLAWRGLAA